jgi:hypothetical protein
MLTASQVESSNHLELELHTYLLHLNADVLSPVVYNGIATERTSLQ